MKIIENKNLKKYNTFGIDVNAKYFVEINDENDLLKLIDSEIFLNNKHFVLSGGSNVLFLRDYNGLIIKMNIKSIQIIEETDEYALISVGAGENWHKFVEYCVNNGYYGLENLAYIPGLVGSAPVQNIGAYSVEQCDYFYNLRGYNLLTNNFISLDNADSNFAYRYSIYKRILKNKFIITNVVYKLNKHFSPNLNYKELKERFDGKNPLAKEVFDAIIEIRKSKLPEPEKIGNAGSFFKNPTVSQEKYLELKQNYSDINGFETPSGIKLSAAYLIEKCGLKGKKFSMNSDARVYEKHSLILVNYNNASGEDIFNLSTEVINKVHNKFGIELEREVNVVK